MIWDDPPEKIQTAIDSVRERIQCIHDELEVLDAEAGLFEQYGEVYERFKQTFVVKRRAWLARERMKVKPDDKDANLRLMAAYEEWEAVDRQKQETEAKRTQLMTEKVKSLERLAELNAKLTKATEQKARKAL